VQTLLDQLLAGRPALAAYVRRACSAPADGNCRVHGDRGFRPSTDQIVEGLVIDNALIPEEIGVYLHPRPRAVTVLEALPACDQCGRQARFDGPDRISGTWGWWCRWCFAEHTVGLVGGAGGVYLLLPDEIPDEARQICDALAAERHLDGELEAGPSAAA
jgi:hypothetical protein